jgi:hypothetical protein
MSQGFVVAATPIHSQNAAVATYQTGGIDMQLFRRAMFVLDVGAFGAGGTVDMKLQSSPDNATWTDLAGGFSMAQMTQAGANNNKISTIEVRAGQLPMPTGRYVRAFVTVGIAATQLAVLPFGGEANHKPGSQKNDASVLQQIVNN